MNKIIYKYPLEFTNPQTIKLPSSAEILYVNSQGNTPTIWAIIDTNDKSTIEVNVYIIGTGQVFDASNKLYVGSCTTENGIFVWHIFVDYSKSENIILPGIDL